MSAIPIRPDGPHALPLRDRAAALGPRATGTTRDDRAHAQLRRLSHQLEGVFLNQLFQAMRKSVPPSAPGSEGAAQQIFESMFDETMAQRAAEKSERGVGEALYRQLERRLSGPSIESHRKE